MAELHHEQESHGSYGSYLAGFILAALLTVGAFWMATADGVTASTKVLTIAVLAVVQIIVHVVFFLHLNRGSNRTWNTLAFAYTVLGVVVIVFGTLWVMCNVGALMMSRPIL